MKIKHITVHRLRIPLRLRFEQSNNSTAISDSTVVEMTTTGGHVGYGESCPRPYVTGEDFNSVERDIQSMIAWLKNAEFQTIDDIRELATQELPRRIGLSAVCALELALLDALCKENNTTLAAALEIKLPERVEYSGVLPLRSPAGLEQLMSLVGRFGFRNLKLKVDSDLAANLARIEAVRATFPVEIPIRVDANCAWSREDALRQIPALSALGIQVFEQVFPKNADEEMARLQQHLGEQIFLMADESMTTKTSAERLIRQSACRRFNLKVSKNGGLFNTLDLYGLARQNGIECQLGAHFGETCILTAAGIVLTAMAGPLTAVEGGLGTHLLEYDLCLPSMQFDEQARISRPSGLLSSPGLNVHIQSQLLVER
ncbi:MAG: N-succinyl-L-Arg/Lys racemase [Saprospiraceae bacterium]|nr:N-succinyl-L-Arg/Lys racemase [Saprospiraceae bacterium]